MTNFLNKKKNSYKNWNTNWLNNAKKSLDDMFLNQNVCAMNK